MHLLWDILKFLAGQRNDLVKTIPSGALTFLPSKIGTFHSKPTQKKYVTENKKIWAVLISCCTS